MPLVNQGTDVSGRAVPWQAQLGAFGAVLEGIKATEQVLRTIVGTQLGTVPGRPDFGVDWLEFLDRPYLTAAPIAARAVTVALERWAPQVSIVRVQLIQGELGQLLVVVVWRPREGGDEVTTEVTRP